jgi:hypothetical protein
MKEILYIARLDARPWIKSNERDLLFPFVLFFLSLEATRQALNVSAPKINELHRYVIMFLVAALLTRAIDVLPKVWRSTYLTKIIQDTFYVALISTAIFVAIRASFPKLEQLDAGGFVSDNLIRPVYALMMSALGVAYLWVSTAFQRKVEFSKLSERKGAHHFFAFRTKERYRLLVIYGFHWIASSTLIALMLLDYSKP